MCVWACVSELCKSSQENLNASLYFSLNQDRGWRGVEWQEEGSVGRRWGRKTGGEVGEIGRASCRERV